MKKSELRQLIREQIKQANLKEEGVLGFDNEAEFMQVLLDYVKSTGKVDELFQMLKAQGMSEEDIMQILNDNNLTLEEGTFEDIGKGIAAIIKAPFEIAIAIIVFAGVLIYQAAEMVVGATIISGALLWRGANYAAKQLIKVPMINAAFKRLAEDPEVIEFCKNPNKSGLRTVLYAKLNNAEKAIIGKWIKENGSRRHLGYSTRYREKPDGGFKKVGMKSKARSGFDPRWDIAE